MRHVPESKLCPFCKEVKPADEFQRNASRPDGLTYTCKVCIPLYAVAPKRQRLDLSNVNKTCSSCNRHLPSRAFLYAQGAEDRLSPQCRTCKMYRPKGNPSVDQVEAFEAEMREIYEAGMEQFDLETDRAQFEAFVYDQMKERKLLVNWKPPIWLHKFSRSAS